MPAVEKTISDEEIYQLSIDKLLKAMELIHANDKILLIMKYKDNFTLKEIMEIMEIGESAVKMRLKRAKNKLVEIYNHID
jgi:RNA polymerase sigma-70 factor (ECF subfamily)